MTIHENAAETEVSTYYTPFSDCSHVNIDSKQTCVPTKANSSGNAYDTLFHTRIAYRTHIDTRIERTIPPPHP